MSNKRFYFDGNEILDSGFFLSGKVQYTDVMNKLDEENEKLKQQLAEKDKEIELLKHIGSHETNMELFKENTKLIIEKRQFAIQELKKVKEDAKNYSHKFVDTVDCIQDYHSYVLLGQLYRIIDQKIKELKGEKE